MSLIQKITLAASVVAVLQATAAILQITTTLTRRSPEHDHHS